MKLNCKFLGTAIFLSCLCAATSIVRGGDGSWQTDFAAAKSQAKAEKKLLLASSCFPRVVG